MNKKIFIFEFNKYFDKLWRIKSKLLLSNYINKNNFIIS